MSESKDRQIELLKTQVVKFQENAVSLKERLERQEIEMVSLLDKVQEKPLPTEFPSSLQRWNFRRDEILMDQRKTIEKLREEVTCSVCMELAYRPFV